MNNAACNQDVVAARESQVGSQMSGLEAISLELAGQVQDLEKRLVRVLGSPGKSSSDDPSQPEATLVPLASVMRTLKKNLGATSDRLGVILSTLEL